MTDAIGAQSMHNRAADTELILRPLSPAIGVEIKGLDLRWPLNPTTITAVRSAWYCHCIIVLRDQSLTEDEQARFGEYLGNLYTSHASHYQNRLRRHPATLFISNVREDGKLIGTLPDGEVHFHSDMAFSASPPVATMLYGLEIPSHGGNTKFANMYAAYETLPQTMKARLEGLSARNVYDPYDAAGAAAMRLVSVSPDAPSHVHPIVRTHPATGRKSLFVNRLMTRNVEGLPATESDNLLNYLFDHQEQEKFVYEHVWKVGDLVLWDNRCTLHARTDFSAQERRLLRRMTVLTENV
jgi:taurine dioxygenase